MKKATLIFWLVILANLLFADYTSETDADSNYGTIGLIVVSAVLISGIIALAWRRKKN